MKPIFERSTNSPLIIVKKPQTGLMIPAHMFLSRGYCADCGKPFGVRVRGLTAVHAKSEADADERERALSLWLQVKKKGICPNCWPAGWRNFIATHCENITYL
jgi:hypothetical protein